MIASLWLEGTALRVLQMAGIGLLLAGFFPALLYRKYTGRRKDGRKNEE